MTGFRTSTQPASAPLADRAYQLRTKTQWCCVRDDLKQWPQQHCFNLPIPNQAGVWSDALLCECSCKLACRSRCLQSNSTARHRAVCSATSKVKSSQPSCWLVPCDVVAPTVGVSCRVYESSIWIPAAFVQTTSLTTKHTFQRQRHGRYLATKEKSQALNY